MKQCTRCLAFKPISAFYAQSVNSKDGYQSHCKQCDNARKEVWKKLNAEKAKEHAKKAEQNRKQSNSRKEWKKQHRQKQHIKSNRNANYAKRRAAKLQRTPKWLTKHDLNTIKAFYAIAQMLSKENNESWHVDHKIPLQGALVSGLHVPSNLQLMRGIENETKRNTYQVN
jgi:hypothetical protein